MMYKNMKDLAPEYLQILFSQRHSAYNLLKKLWGKADPVQTKHQLFETKLLLQRGHVMEYWVAQTLIQKNAPSVEHF